MGVRFPSVASNTFVGPLPANATETVILVTPPLNISLDFSQVLILWSFQLTAGTGTTSITTVIRRGNTVNGTSIMVSGAITVTAGNIFGFSGFFPDTPGAVAGQQYVVTVTQTGATAAGTIASPAVLAFAL